LGNYEDKTKTIPGGRPTTLFAVLRIIIDIFIPRKDLLKEFALNNPYVPKLSQS
jgi:hypothetical protein